MQGTLRRRIATSTPKPASPSAESAAPYALPPPKRAYSLPPRAPSGGTAAAPPTDSDALLAPIAAAAVLGVQPKLLERWRATGEGPAFVRLSCKTIRYRACDLEEFVRSNVRRNTAA
jgi:hypothetical protein